MSLAARFWGVPPWELETRPDGLFWTARALQIRQAESAAQEIQMKAAEQRAKTQGR